MRRLAVVVLASMFSAAFTHAPCRADDATEATEAPVAAAASAASSELLASAMPAGTATAAPTSIAGLAPVSPLFTLSPAITGFGVTKMGLREQMAADPGAPPRNVPLAIGEAIGINVVVNLFDQATHEHPEEFYVSPETWWENIQENFNWDDNNFVTNQFAHPYHGNTYYNAGRSNGLTYYESAALTALGSLTWEFFGEVNRPSFNDFFNTTLGGISMGEMLHRTATTVRDNQATGFSRTWREATGFLIDPVGGFNRILRGESGRVWANPEEHDPERLRVYVGYGVLARGDEDFRFGSDATGGVFDFRMNYGNPFAEQKRPFDTYSFRLEMASADSGLINGIRGEGILVAFGDPTTERSASRFALTHRFDFYDNAAYQYGGQILEGRYASTKPKGESSDFYWQAGAQVVLLGAVNSEFTGLTLRQYDYGPGVGLDVGFAWRKNDTRIAWLDYQIINLWTTAGDNGSHQLQRGELELTIPIMRELVAWGSAGYFRRTSQYDNADDVAQWSPEWRAGLMLRTY
jgi:hypothetical protein